MARSNNGPQVGVLDLGSLLDPQRAARERLERMTPEERHQAAKEAFVKMIDQALAGCGDPSHAKVEQACADMIHGIFNFAVLPEPVAKAVVRCLVTDALHRDDTGDGLKWLTDPNTLSLALTVAGATLRFAQTDETAGVPVATGVYL